LCAAARINLLAKGKGKKGKGTTSKGMSYRESFIVARNWKKKA